MRYFYLLFIVVIVLGCAPRTVTVSGDRGSQVLEQTKYESEGTDLEVIGEGRGFMPSKLVRVTIIKEEMVDGFLKLHLGFRSKSSQFKTMQYLVTFFDDKGMPLEKFNVGWLPISVNPRAYTYQQVMAKTRDAKTYKLHVRKLKDIDTY